MAAQTENVILITLDGVRTEEMFTGVDLRLLKELAGQEPVESLDLYRSFWADSPKERREKLLPFFWTEWMKNHGSILGNRDKGSVMKLSNVHWFSYPGYSEILTGQAHDRIIKSNAKIQNPFPSFLQFIKNERLLSKEQVAVFASWDVFPWISENKPGSLTINAGFTDYTLLDQDSLLKLNELQKETSTPWDSVRHDAYTFRFAMAHIKAFKPRVLYLSLGETDDWAHEGRYDRVVQMLRQTDDYLRELWDYLQSDPQYRNKTSILVTTDHGRGTEGDSWKSHNRSIPGAEYVWLAVISPDVERRGEWEAHNETFFSNQIAASLCLFLDLDYTKQNPEAGRPIKWD